MESRVYSRHNNNISHMNFCAYLGHDDHLVECLLLLFSRLASSVRISFSVSLFSGYAHVFILLSIVVGPMHVLEQFQHCWFHYGICYRFVRTLRHFLHFSQLTSKAVQIDLQVGSCLTASII